MPTWRRRCSLFHTQWACRGCCTLHFTPSEVRPGCCTLRFTHGEARQGCCTRRVVSVHADAVFASHPPSSWPSVLFEERCNCRCRRCRRHATAVGLARPCRRPTGADARPPSQASRSRRDNTTAVGVVGVHAASSSQLEHPPCRRLPSSSRTVALAV